MRELITLKDSELQELLKETECEEQIEEIKQEIRYRLECYLY